MDKFDSVKTNRRDSSVYVKIADFFTDGSNAIEPQMQCSE